MDVRWVAYIGSGLLAAASLAPVTWQRAAEERPASGAPVRPPAPRDGYRRLLDVERDVARLRRYQLDAPVPRLPARNPFRYGSAAHAGPAPHVPPVAEVPADAVPSPAPALHVLRLVGLVERRIGDTMVLTAVLAGFGDVHLVGAGDRVADRYTVLSVSADGVDLKDDHAADTVHLAFEREP